MVASVTCLCKEPAGPNVSHAFNWDHMPQVNTVITQLSEVVKSYDSSEKAKYLAIITSIYDYLAQQNVMMVQKVLQDADLKQWIWHGDGFITADKVMLLYYVQIGYVVIVYVFFNETVDHNKYLFSGCINQAPV